VDVAVIGGTGREGLGLALRLASAGHAIVIGSRVEERGIAAAERVREQARPSARVHGTTNDRAAAQGDVVFLSVPFAGHADACRAIKPHLRPAAVVVDVTSPLATAVGGRAWQVIRPWHGSAAEQAEAILGPDARVVSGFHSVAARSLQDLDNPVRGDVFVSGRDPEAKELVGSLIQEIPHLRWADVGDLSMARVMEPLTAILIALNRRYKTRDTTFQLLGRDEWGTPRP
jgi:8-hydroxy-5-deazaflavin:NADPH oxidoreductase